MRLEIVSILEDFKSGKIKFQLAHDLIVSLIGENELSGSDVQEEHGDLNDVRNRNASDQVAEASKTSVELPLGSRTDTERHCYACNRKLTIAGVCPNRYCPNFNML